MYIWWGPDLACLYNDAYRQSIGPERHPGSLGRPAREVWAEIWDIIGPQIAQVMDGRGATWNVNALVPITRNGRREDVYWTYSYGPIDDEAAPNGVGGVLVVCTETTQTVLAERRRAEEAARQRRIFEQAPSFVCIMTGPEHIFEFVNNAHRELFNSGAWIGKPVREAFPDIAGQGYYERLDEAYRSGIRYVAKSAPVRYRRLPDDEAEERLMDFIYEPVTDGAGAITGIFCEGFDVTETRRAEEHRALLLDELNHRVRNTLAVVQAIARQTFKGGEETRPMVKAFEGRLMALATAHALLTQTSWQKMPLRELVDGAVRTCSALPERFRVAGPPLMLEAKAAIALSLALHELCTNAMKYGALSSDGGVVELTWRIVDESKPTLDLNWREEGGPPVVQPDRSGFGLTMIERVLAHEIRGDVTTSFAPSGLICSIRAPLTDGQSL